MNAYELAKQEQAKIAEQAALTAYAVIAILGRKEDEISKHEAYQLYDRGWINDRTKRGMLHFARKGATEKSAKVYSRFEIETLKRAEKNITELYANIEREAKSLTDLIER